MGLLSNVKTIQTTRTEDILNEEELNKGKAKQALKRNIASDSITTNALKALILMGKFETARDAVSELVESYAENNLTPEEKITFNYMRDSFDEKDMRDSQKK